jgi:DHA2 family multidrug resistance protein
MNAKGSHHAAVFAIALAVLTQSLDSKMLPTVLPLVRGDFALSIDASNWLQIVYFMANFALLPMSPWIVDRFGRRRVVMTCLLGFVASASASAIAPNYAFLFLTRALQGACGAGLIATCHAALRESEPDDHLGTSQAAFVGSFIGLPIALGPFIGGWIYDNQLSWRCVFGIEIAVGILAFTMCARFLPERAPSQQRMPFDFLGGMLLAASLVPLQYVLSQGDRSGWFDDPTIVALSIIAGISFIAFVLCETHKKRGALIDFGALSRRPTVVVGTLLIFPVGICLVAIVAIIVGFVEELLGFTATMAGELVLVRAASFIPFAVGFGVLMDRVKPKPQFVVPLGLVLLAAASALQAFSITTSSNFTTIIGPLILGGIAIGPTLIPLLWAVFRSVPRSSRETLRVCTAVDITLQLGTVTASAVIATAIDQRFAFHYDILRSAATSSRLAEVVLPSHISVITLLTELTTQQSYAMAFGDAALLTGSIAFLAFPVALFLRKHHAKDVFTGL